jgi:DNA polymerase V
MSSLITKSAVSLAELECRFPGRIIRAEPAPSLASIPLYASAVPAGFPSPADDYVDRALDLNEYLVQDEPATFMVRVKGDSMIGAHIQPDDVLIIDRGLSAQHGDIVVAEVDGQFTVKELHMRGDRVALVARNRAYPPIILGDEQELVIFGVVTGVVRKLKGVR